MKKHFLMAALACLSFLLSAQNTNPNYDSTLAKKLGSDDYGMKAYVLVILKTGSNTSASKTFTDSCFAGHMKNMDKLVDDGKLIVAGPIGKNDNNYRGIFILNVTEFADANALLETDPAVKNKLLSADLYKWYGSAALPQYLEYSDKIWKKGF